LPTTFLVAESITSAPFLGYLLTILGGIALTGELELNTGRLGGNLLSPMLIFLFSNAPTLEKETRK
jgi:hypothetical protein